MSTKNQATIIFSFLFVIGLFKSYALDIYVSPKGAGSNFGTSSKPLKTFAAAQKKAQKHAGKEAVTIHFDKGGYLPETNFFSSNDSGTESFPVMYRAINEGKSILSGGAEFIILSLEKIKMER